MAVADAQTIRHQTSRNGLVGLGVVTCRDSRVTGTWSTLVNPGFPVVTAPPWKRCGGPMGHDLRAAQLAGRAP